MKKIPISKGQEAIVDDEDYEELSQFTWYTVVGTHTSYVARHIRLPEGKETTITMHRQILCLPHGDSRQGDHINHNGLDNRRGNLRIVTPQENQFNQKKRKGYCWCPRSKRWRAYIRVKGHQKYLGLHVLEEAANAAYLRAKSLYHTIMST